jgi:acyl carrier protein
MVHGDGREDSAESSDHERANVWGRSWDARTDCNRWQLSLCVCGGEFMEKNSPDGVLETIYRELSDFGEGFTEETEFTTIGDFDSLEFLDLCLRVSEVFQITIPDPQLGKINNIGDLRRVVDCLRAERDKEIHDYVSG